MRPRRSAMLSRGAVQQRRHKPDYLLLVFSILLLVIGLIVVYAISPGLSATKQVGENYFVTKQLIAVGLGIGAFIAVNLVPLQTWKSLQKPLLIFAVAATLVALVLPVSADYPAHRWIRLGGISLQSVELVKMAVVICLSAFLADRIKEGSLEDKNRTFKPLLFVLAGVTLVIAIAQKDLGSAAVIFAMMAAMVFVAGLPMKRILMVGGVAVIGLMLLILPFGYRRDRILTYLNPEADCQSAGYQACQALIAVGSGGVFGKGLAHSGQAYGYLPEAANDSIFAIISEKFGFVGASMLIILFMAFFIRIKNIMERAPDDYSRLIVVGVLAWLSTQALINIGAMIGLLPLKGITLPFISYGGTSVVFVMAAVGLVFNISRYTTYSVNERTERTGSENTVDWRGNRRTYNAPVGRRA